MVTHLDVSADEVRCAADVVRRLLESPALA
jgi:hypothetical protein